MRTVAHAKMSSWRNGVAGVCFLALDVTFTGSAIAQGPVAEAHRYPLFIQPYVQSAVPPTGATSGAGTLRWQGIDPAALPVEIRESKQFKRWWNDFYPAAYPQGYRDHALLYEGWSQIMATKTAQGSLPSAGQWNNLGPDTEIGTHDGGNSGRVTDIAVSPVNNNLWLLATPGGGVWRTADGGTTWVSTMEDEPQLTVGAVEFSQSNPLVAYAGTGDYARNFQPGSGLYRSEDAGQSWTFIESPNLVGGLSFFRILVDPNDENTLVGALSDGLYRSTDAGSTWAASIIPAVDANNNPVPDIQSTVTDVETEPGVFARQYLGVADIQEAGVVLTKGGVARSFDGGMTWSRLSGPWDDVDFRLRVEIAIGASTAFVAVYQLDLSDPNPVVRLWRTTGPWSATPQWVEIDQTGMVDGLGFPSPNGFCSGQCSYNLRLTMHPSNENLLFAGGIQLWKYDVTLDHWLDITRESTAAPGADCGGIHVDQHTFEWVGNRLLVGNDGGLYSTIDNGSTWVGHNIGLSTQAFYHGSVNPVDGTVMMGGLQDSGTPFSPPLTSPLPPLICAEPSGSPQSWQEIGPGDGGDGFFADSLPLNPFNAIAFSTQNLNVFRRVGSAECNVTELLLPPADPDRPFIGTVEKCPTSDEIVIAGTNSRLYKTSEFFSGVCQAVPPSRPAWTQVCPLPLSAQVRAMGFFGASCDQIVFAPEIGDLTTGAPRVIRTFSGGASCQIISSGLPNDAVIMDIATDKANPDIAYIASAGVASAGIYKTTTLTEPFDVSWIDVTPADMIGGDIATQYNTVRIDPSNPEIVYAGSQHGLFRSNNGGDSWVHVGAERGVPMVDVRDIQFDTASPTNRAIVFTHRRGVYGCGLDDQDSDQYADGCDNCPTQPNPAQNVCEGDCNEDCTVGIGDLVLASSVALGDNPVSRCIPADRNDDGRVDIGELIRSARSALDGCFEPVSSPQVYDPVQVDVGHGEGVVGANVAVPITMTSADDAAGVLIDILYDSTLGEVTDPSSDCTLGSALSPTEHSISASAAPLLPAPPGFSRLRVAVLPKSLLTPMPVGLNGEVAVCTFAVDGNAPPDTYDLTVDLVEVSDEDAHEMTVVHTDGTLRVCPGCACQ